MHCTKCKQLGHTLSHCCNKQRCATCGANHADNACSAGTPICPYCNGEPHEINVCPRYKQRQDKSKQHLKARSQRSFAEILKAAAPTPSVNQFQVLTDIDLPVGESADAIYTPLPSAGRKRTACSPTLPRKVARNAQTDMQNPQGRAVQKPKQVAPGLTFAKYNQEFPALPGAAETLATSSAQETNAASGFISFSTIADWILNTFNVPESIKCILVPMLPSIKMFLKSLASKWPLISTIISFDA